MVVVCGDRSQEGKLYEVPSLIRTQVYCRLELARPIIGWQVDPPHRPRRVNATGRRRAHMPGI